MNYEQDKPIVFHLNKFIFSCYDKIIVSYKNIPENEGGWFGIWHFRDGHGYGKSDLDDGPWHKNQTNDADIWVEITQSSGDYEIQADTLLPGRYAAFFLEKNGYEWLSNPIIFDIANQRGEIDLKVLTMNIWQEGTQVTGGFEGIVDEIASTNADIVSLAEVRNYDDTILTQRLLDSLDKKGLKYYSYKSERDVGILSRYPIIEHYDFSDSFTKATIKVNNVDVVLYSAHLDYTNYACHLPRGYDGNGDKLPLPDVDIKNILRINDSSWRPSSIKVFIGDAKHEINSGRVVLLAGDFNEPSHLDWTYATRNLFDHNGAIVPWTSTKLLRDAGYLDSYRVRYPDPVLYPGFTWVADNPDADVTALTWVPEADERDRIDFIFYYPDSRLTVDDAIIVGPAGSIVKSERVIESGNDKIKIPEGVWPSDHKAILTVFKLGVLQA